MTERRKEALQAFAITAPELEAVLSRDLNTLDLQQIQTVPGGVSFHASIEDVMRVNLWSRVATRVVVRVDEFHASTFHELERRAKRIDWARFVSKGQLISFRVTCRKSRLYHSDAVAQRLGDAAMAATGARIEKAGDEENDGLAQLFIVRFAHDQCTISVDSSGALLHRRGYRQAVAKAPLRETLAAAMLYGSGWNHDAPLVDPMCGSGTVAIEAAMMARRIAPGGSRSFAFENWPQHDPSAWRKLVDDAKSNALSNVPAPIVASDRDAGAVEASVGNAKRAGVQDDIQFSQKPLSDAEFPGNPGLLISNPPYGVRVGETAPLRNLYAQLGKLLRGPAAGYRIALLSADKALEAQLRTDLREVFRTTNGGIPVRLMVGAK